MNQPVLFVVPGTWEPDNDTGMLGGVTRLLRPGAFDVRWIDYPRSFGMVPGRTGEPVWGSLGDPSYVRSRELGKTALENAIRSIPGRRFGLLGYSQGGAIVSLVGRDLVSGALRDRARDCRWLHAFASPHRGLGRAFPGGPTLIPDQGISGDNIEDTGHIEWWDFCLPGDLYGASDLDGTYLEQVYGGAIELSVASPGDMLGMVAATAAAVEKVAAIAIEKDGPVESARKVANTVDALVRFQRTFPHARYGLDPIAGGQTALAISADHLNRTAAQ